jgi:hypothetical protein
MVGPDPEDPVHGIRYGPGAFPRKWAKPTQAEVNYFSGWDSWFNTVPIKRIDEERRVITLEHGGYQWDFTPFFLKDYPQGAGKHFYVENLLEELDQPGEWCYDAEEGTVYFWPPSGTIEEDDEIVVPVLEGLVKLEGVSWVNIQGFNFTETANGDNMHPQNAEGTGAMCARVGWKYCGDALRLEDCQWCRVEGNRFDQVGGNAIYLFRASNRNTVQQNEIGYAGTNGICIDGMSKRQPLFNQVLDNHIHHTGVFNRYTAGVFLATSDGNLVAHNLIEEVPHHAINLAVNAEGRNVVEYNRIRHTCKVIRDTGAINSWMEIGPPEKQRCGHVIRHNFVSDTHHGSRGLYLDNFSSNCLVYGNIFARVEGCAVFVHGGKNNNIENNIVVDSGTVSFGMGLKGWDYWDILRTSGFTRGNHVSRNVFFNTDRWGLGISNLDDLAVGYSDHNVYFGGPEDQEQGGWNEWRQKGFDPNSVAADPLFVDLSKDDYRLKPESPALELGFRPIEAARIGLRRQS